jgi:hypothetical protein
LLLGFRPARMRNCYPGGPGKDRVGGCRTL